MKAETIQEISQATPDSVLQLLSSSGFNDLEVTMQNRAYATHAAMVHDTVLKRKAELDDIRSGMADVKDEHGKNLLVYLEKCVDDIQKFFPR